MRRGRARMMMRRGRAMMMRRGPAMMMRRGPAMMMRRGSAMMVRRGGASLIGGRGGSPRGGWRGLGDSGTAVGFHGSEAGRRTRYMAGSERRPLLERLLVTAAAVGGRGQPSPRHLSKVQMLLLLLLLE
jgi:hypothetical protein